MTLFSYAGVPVIAAVVVSVIGSAPVAYSSPATLAMVGGVVIPLAWRGSGRRSRGAALGAARVARR